MTTGGHIIAVPLDVKSRATLAGQDVAELFYQVFSIHTDSYTHNNNINKIEQEAHYHNTTLTISCFFIKTCLIILKSFTSQLRKIESPFIVQVNKQ